MKILRLVRLPNLLLIVLAQVLVRYCLVIPAFRAEYFVTGFFPPGLSDLQFILLVVSTVLLAAGGYMINDYYDVDIDSINKPDKVIVGERIPANTVLTAYGILTALGCLLGIYLAFSIGKLMVLGSIHVFVAFSLWIYAAQLKKQLLVGNVRVALLSALSLLIVGLFEPEFYRNIIILAPYAVFAFVLSLVREIIKDMEDLDGDERGQVKSLPVRFGIKRTRLVVLVLILLTAWGLAEVLRLAFYNNPVFSFRNMVILCEFPFAILLYLVATASEKKDFRIASLFSKVIMFLGVASMLPLYYFFIR